uniref:Reverse transcriptase zinc-binding domain-containing protein n=1 Tax=Setaria viridis TaxID=4556 RepID=A0A4U6SRZ3_SETVI|nr:hypothetical protein SEVIR_9G052600v2 [Setaria viridis]
MDFPHFLLAHSTYSTLAPGSPWWETNMQAFNTKQKRSLAAILMYTAWHLWKERNRRIFQNQAMRPDQLLGLIQSDVLLRRMATGFPLLKEELLFSQ